MKVFMRVNYCPCILIGLLLLISSLTLAQVPDNEKVRAGAERAFEKFASSIVMPAPGCSVGVSLNGRVVFENAFGLAEMEYKIPNTPQTIFESGSVAKQFTAAAIVLLAQDGKLSLDDPVRKYLPEMPDYGSPLTIRQMLHHTAGLRDWGNVMALTGVGRGDRVVTQELALDVLSRQKGLDFKPGDEFSYSNSGYNLAAIIVERVSKQKFGDFLLERFFKPLGMTHSSIRDDYRRVVPGRAQAYSRDAKGEWLLNMPFMNVYGNGGMLTTVGDWSKWNAMLDGRTFNAKLVDELETQGVLNDGRKIPYALGLAHEKYRGISLVGHGGGTAGYQTFLVRYPEKTISIALLCNGPSPSSGEVANKIIDEIYGPFPAPSPAPAAVETLSEDKLKRFVGLWRDTKTHSPVRTSIDGGMLKLGNNKLLSNGENSFRIGSAKIKFTTGKDDVPTAVEVDRSGDIQRLAAEKEWAPAASDLRSFAGDWYSEEAGAAFTFAVEGDKAFLVQRPSTKLSLQAVYKDHFSAGGYMIWFTHDKSGKITQLHIGGSRARDILFERFHK